MMTDILDDDECINHFFLGLDPVLIDIVRLRNQDEKFKFVSKSTMFHDQAGENHAKKEDRQLESPIQAF